MNTSRTQQFGLIAALAGALALSACGKKEEAPPAAPATTPAPAAPAETAPPPAAPAGVEVSAVDLGTAVGPDQKVTAPTTEFAPTDTIYAAVSTTGTAPNAVLDAKWTFQDGQTVNESSQTIAPSGPAVTSFHISKPDGWPAGNYKVEITLDGKMVASKDFTVK
ncbi:MAG: hypothetical protein GXC76_02760 [Rhodanobacteraceae bacterium]|jgi:hypothetical protein|nr:hypothetical protein [Rhodanobacteraceae bacterium]